MKFMLYTLVFSLVSLFSVNAQEKHLFILSGQSNMAGLNPDLSFTPTVIKEFGKDKVIVVKDAQGGQPIRRWYKDWKPASGELPKGAVNGDLYDKLMTKVKAAIEGQKIKSVTFVWMQGESDAKSKNGDVYAASFKGVLEQLRKDLGRQDINFVIGRISDFDMENKKFPHWTLVRDVQVKIAEESPHGAWVETDDLNDIKNKENALVRHDLHYTADGYKILGQRFAESSIKLINKPADKAK